MGRPPAAVLDVFSVIGHPRRREILGLLATEDRGVSALVAELGVAQATVSEHLALLRSVGLVESRKRGRERVYRLDPQPLHDVTDWIAQLETFWDSRIDRLGRLLESIESESEQ